MVQLRTIHDCGVLSLSEWSPHLLGGPAWDLMATKFFAVIPQHLTNVEVAFPRGFYNKSRKALGDAHTGSR